jgi:hypothetical protein
VAYHPAVDEAPESVAQPVRKQSTETLAKLHEGMLRLELRSGATKIYARTCLQGKALIKSTSDGDKSLPTDRHRRNR